MNFHRLMITITLLTAVPVAAKAAEEQSIQLQYQRGAVVFSLDPSMAMGADGRPREAVSLLGNAWSGPTRASSDGRQFTAMVGDLKLPHPTGGDPNAGVELSCKVALVKNGDKGPSGGTCNDWLGIGCVDIYDCSITLSIGK